MSDDATKEESYPPEIRESLRKFSTAHPDPLKAAFVMMDFEETQLHKDVFARIENKLGELGINALRADRGKYHDDLYWNVVTHIYGCSCGVAVLDRITDDSINANVTLEVGYMLALRKPVCLLTDDRLPKIPNNLIGKLRYEFSTMNVDDSIDAALDAWLKDQDLGLPVATATQWIEELYSRSTYKDWKFRINWPVARTSPRVDAFSNAVDCSGLFNSLLSPELGVSRQEFLSVLGALQRATTTDVPPRKLSGEMLFEEVSKKVLDGVQRALGSTPYETSKDRHKAGSDELGEPVGLLPIASFSGDAEALSMFVDTQARIAKTASHVCKSVQCSTYQISISQALHWPDRSGGLRLWMACTARNTSKENLATGAEIPLMTVGEKGRMVWYGQPGRKPTSEYQSHWRYHDLSFARGTRRTLIVHFHPTSLLAAYEKLCVQHDFAIPGDLWSVAVDCAASREVFLRVFRDYRDIGARDKRFGAFMDEASREADKANKSVVLVWKPDHGLWLITGGDCTADDIRPLLDRSERVSEEIANALVGAPPSSA